MQNIPDTLGDVLKTTRLRAGITTEALAEQVGITERYLYRIENEGKKPSYDVLFRLIRALNIAPEEIFYPDRPSDDSEIAEILRLLSACDERSLKVIKATANALIATATVPKK